MCRVIYKGKCLLKLHKSVVVLAVSTILLFSFSYVVFSWVYGYPRVLDKDFYEVKMLSLRVLEDGRQASVIVKIGFSTDMDSGVSRLNFRFIIPRDCLKVLIKELESFELHIAGVYLVNVKNVIAGVEDYSRDRVIINFTVSNVPIGVNYWRTLYPYVEGKIPLSIILSYKPLNVTRTLLLQLVAESTMPLKSGLKPKLSIIKVSTGRETTSISGVIVYSKDKYYLNLLRSIFVGDFGFVINFLAFILFIIAVFSLFYSRLYVMALSGVFPLILVVVNLVSSSIPRSLSYSLSTGTTLLMSCLVLLMSLLLLDGVRAISSKRLSIREELFVILILLGILMLWAYSLNLLRVLGGVLFFSIVWPLLLLVTSIAFREFLKKTFLKDEKAKRP